MGTLYLVATPIGNLDDITLRALQVRESVPLIAAEDTRHTMKLLTHFGLRRPLVTGTPALSDPGVRLVSAAVASGYPVVPIPGPSAVLAALVSSGLPTNQFTFLGFLPRKRGELERLIRETALAKRSFIFFESPHRIQRTLDIMASALGPRSLVVAREITKLHEEFLRGTPATLLEHFAKFPPRGELTVVVAGSDWKASDE